MPVQSAAEVAISQAETAMEKRDYAAAERLLLPVTNTDENAYRAWFDLAYAYNAMGDKAKAIDAYRRSVAAKPGVFAANMNLGLLLASEGQNKEAIKYLRAATTLKPDNNATKSMAQVWYVLAGLLETSSPNDAIAAYKKVSELQPNDPEPHLRCAALLAKSKQADAAENEYKEALSLAPGSKEAKRGLLQLEIDSGRTSDAEAMLRSQLKQDPNDSAAHFQLGQLLLKSGQSDAALAEYESAYKNQPQDPGVLHEIAALYAANKKYPEAALRYQKLVEIAPTVSAYRHEYGVILMHEFKPSEAQAQLIAALQSDAKNVGAYGDLALAASENKDYPLAIKVLDARAKLAAETPATYFLRATAYDNLKVFDKASENYHQFLAADNGQFPDREWQARHRLIAIEPVAKKRRH